MSIISIRRTPKASGMPLRSPHEKRTPSIAHAALDDPYLAFVRWRAAGRPAGAAARIDDPDPGRSWR